MILDRFTSHEQFLVFIAKLRAHAFKFGVEIEARAGFIPPMVT
jgi:hypothetical protein